MTEFEIQRTAMAVVNLLLEDDRFLRRIEKILPKKSRMLNSSQAASALGISKWTLRSIAPYIGGIKNGCGKQSKWVFEEDGLKERYLDYINLKKTY